MRQPSALGMIPLFAVVVSAGIGSGCMHPATPPCAEADTARRTGFVEGLTIPWPDVQVTYLGLTDLGVANGDDVAFRWRIDHPAGLWPELTVTPLTGRAGVMAESIELHLDRREEASTYVRLRVTLGDAAAVGGQVGVSVGIRVSRVDVVGNTARNISSWEVAQHQVTLSRPHGATAPPIRDPSSDGSLAIEMVTAPSVPTLGDAWVMELGATYEIVYRVYNHTSDRRRVRITGLSFRAAIPEAVVELAAGAYVDVPVPTTPTQRGLCGHDRSCHLVAVEFDGDTRRRDSVERLIFVE